MPKAKVNLPKGTETIRIHRTDNTFFDLKDGDTVELDEVPGRQREERLMDKHFVPITTPVPEAAQPTAAPSKGKK
jgi:hypothetical protein